MELNELQRLLGGLVQQFGKWCKKLGGWTVPMACGCKDWVGKDGDLRHCTNCKRWKEVK